MAGATGAVAGRREDTRRGSCCLEARRPGWCRLEAIGGESGARHTVWVAVGWAAAAEVVAVEEDLAVAALSRLACTTHQSRGTVRNGEERAPD